MPTKIAEAATGFCASTKVGFWASTRATTKVAAPTHLSQWSEGTSVPNMGCRAGTNTRYLRAEAQQQPAAFAELLPPINSAVRRLQHGPHCVSPAQHLPPNMPCAALPNLLALSLSAAQAICCSLPWWRACHLPCPDPLPSSHFYLALCCLPSFIQPCLGLQLCLLRSLFQHHWGWADDQLSAVVGVGASAERAKPLLGLQRWWEPPVFHLL